MKPLNNLIVIFLAHTSEVCKVLIGTMSIQVSKDNHDSWRTCTTSAECKTIITAVLTVMSSMDPPMISGNLGWVLLSLGWVVSKWVLLGCGLVTVSLRDAIETSSLRRQVHYLFTRLVKAHVLPLLSVSQTKV
jgi:hypothetical protein